MAFECLEDGHYHVQSDFVYFEFLDKNKKPVPYNKPGNLIVTRLYGSGTPIIRYTGIEDVLVPIKKTTNCGITTQMIKKIEGRTADLLILPDGKMIAPLAITGIPAQIMEDYNTYKIKQFQIIQHSKSEIEILVVFDEKIRNKGVPAKTLLNEIKNRFTKTIGKNVKIEVTEKKEIQKDVRSDYVQVVVSKGKKI
jgi:phenylacetate-CoA ligase